MLVFSMLLAAQTPSLPVPSEDIIVTGRRLERLKRLRMTTTLDPATGITHCVFKRRSGDAALDVEICNAVLACVPKVNTVEDMRACVAPTMDRLVAKGVPWQADAAKGGK